MSWQRAWMKHESAWVERRWMDETQPKPEAVAMQLSVKPQGQEMTDIGRQLDRPCTAIRWAL